MEPDETKSVQQSQSPNLNSTNSKTPPTLHIAGIEPLPPRSSNSGESNPKPDLLAGLRLPLKRAGTIVVILFILALVISGLFNLAKGALDSLTAKKPATITSSPAEQSQPIATTTLTPTTETSNKNDCTDLPTRMAQAKIAGQQVDTVFYQKHPDRVNKPLTDAESDRALRQEWCAVANKLIKMKGNK
jgi:hypothetical protein